MYMLASPEIFLSVCSSNTVGQTQYICGLPKPSPLGIALYTRYLPLANQPPFLEQAQSRHSVCSQKTSRMFKVWNHFSPDCEITNQAIMTCEQTPG
jgi:hypothetical protein